MTWAKLDDGFWMHPKVIEAGNTGAGIYARMLAYCGCYLSDGEVPAPIMATIVGRDRGGLDSLAKSALIELHEDGSATIPDFLEFNPSREEIEGKRRKDSSRKAQRRREESARSPRGVRADETVDSAGNPQSLAGGGPQAYPDPTRPDPTPPSPPRGNRTRDREKWEKEAVDYASAVGVTGPAPQVIGAVEQAAKWKRAETPDEFREFARQSFPSLNVVASLPDERSAA